MTKISDIIKLIKKDGPNCIINIFKFYLKKFPIYNVLRMNFAKYLI